MKKQSGFTLIELSIVLVIIGLLVGGVLFGRDLIAAAEARSQISQIRGFNLAVRTFQNKYNCLPGDCKHAEDFGFPTRLSNDYDINHGNGNGLIENNSENGPGNINHEILMFWGDLILANIIPGPKNTVVHSFDTNDNYSNSITVPNVTSYEYAYLPPAKISGNFVHVWSGGWGQDSGIHTGMGAHQSFMDNVYKKANNTNYFSIILPEGADITDEGNFQNRTYASRSGLRVSQAYAIDSKMDDGLPQAGKVTTMIPNGADFGVQYASGGGTPEDVNLGTPATFLYGTSDETATEATEHTCFDNGNVDGETQRYSMSQNNGDGINCALSFEFQ